MDSISTRLASFQISEFVDRLGLERLRTETGALQNRFSNLKSVTDFFDVKRMSKPQGWVDAQSRINYNLSYFSANYAVIFALLSVYSLITNPLLLFVIIFVIGGMYGIGMLQGNDLHLGITSFTTSQLYTGLLIIALPLGFIASPLSTILWLIGASGVTILGHAAIMEKPIESAFADEQV
ncbi:uncharacterized protein SAPINGB_P003122 [Magnusiomyces paraingens]|uniref:PRA1 family protein n=1 Tax=Magnusiomyces paraingens TaxID=2606893 RepID=A0A5E8BIL6_9ASCO|nr:uncharacterized protein SAPINGB_P003122 [Saprochaete ingens]VVT51516.1 unnamed protein product [Saprochaete ingens]